MSKEYVVLDTITATAGDLTWSKGSLQLGNSTAGLLKFKYKNVTSYKAIPYVAETLQVATGTPTAVNSTEYTVFITQNVDGKNITVPFSFTSDPTATATEIVTGFKTLINACPTLKITASGSTTLILTAQAGYTFFNVMSPSGIAWVATTAGVTPQGLGSALITQGFTRATATTHYRVYQFTTEVLQPASDPTLINRVATTYYLLASETASNFSDLDTAIVNAATADDGAGVANPKVIAIN